MVNWQSLTHSQLQLTIKQIAMFKNYFKIAARHLVKQKLYSVIKIGGFALSIAACLLIALYIKDELSYDRSYPATDRIYRITGEYNNNGKIETGADWPQLANLNSHSR